MVKNAVKWATEKGLTRTNPVHGATEYRVAVFEKFNNTERDRTATSAFVGAEVQDPLYIFRFGHDSRFYHMKDLPGNICNYM